MYPLVQIGSLNLSTGGLFLLLAAFLASWLAGRFVSSSGEPGLLVQLDSTIPIAVIGAIIGARLWYGLFNWDLYAPNLGLFLALRLADFAWPGALLVGLLAGSLWAKTHHYSIHSLADVGALALPLPQALACIGLLLSGDVLGRATDLPWGINLFGTARHPTQLYYLFAALLCFGVLLQFRRYSLPPGCLSTAYISIQGLTWLLLEPLRVDSLLVLGGVRVAQILGLLFLMAALIRWRKMND